MKKLTESEFLTNLTKGPEQRSAELIRGKTIKDVVEEDFWDNEWGGRINCDRTYKEDKNEP